MVRFKAKLAVIALNDCQNLVVLSPNLGFFPAANQFLTALLNIVNNCYYYIKRSLLLLHQSSLTIRKKKDKKKLFISAAVVSGIFALFHVICLQFWSLVFNLFLSWFCYMCVSEFWSCFELFYSNHHILERPILQIYWR